MNENEFTGTIAGRVRWVYNRRYCFFRANPLPFEIKVSVRLRRRFRSAVMGLCRLDGMMHQLSDRERGIMTKLFMIKEAIYSSSIDSDSPSVDELLWPRGLNEQKGRSIRDVQNYIESLRYASMCGAGSKITSFTITELHKRLLDTEEGRNLSPGELRVEQNFIGKKWDTLETARFVPADPMSLPGLMENLMKYINTSFEDPLYKIALAHYQFEIIHPLRDGNGRMGRLLASTMMFSEGMMMHSAIPISEYLFEHKEEYLDALFNVSAKDDFDSWFSLFLDAVSIQAERSVRMIKNVLTLRNRLLKDENIVSRRIVIESLFENPYITVSDVMDRTGLTRPGALKQISAMIRDGILEEVSGKQRGRVYLASAIRKAAFGK